MDDILEVAGEHGINVIENTAQAIKTKNNQQKSTKTIDSMGYFSFFPSKNLGGFGDGGMVVTNDAALAETLHILKIHNKKPKYHHNLIKKNFQLDTLQTTILHIKLKYLPL